MPSVSTVSVSVAVISLRSKLLGNAHVHMFLECDAVLHEHGNSNPYCLFDVAVPLLHLCRQRQDVYSWQLVLRHLLLCELPGVYAH